MEMGRSTIQGRNKNYLSIFSPVSESMLVDLTHRDHIFGDSFLHVHNDRTWASVIPLPGLPCKYEETHKNRQDISTMGGCPKIRGTSLGST